MTVGQQELSDAALTHDKHPWSIQLAKTAGLSTERFPCTTQEAETAERILAQEFDKLSVEEHEKVLFDLYGSDLPEEKDFEDPMMVHRKLVELDVALGKIVHKPAFDQAFRLHPAYVQDRSFRLMFLRAQDYDAQKAAEQMVLHFRVKRDLFPEEKMLARPIQLSDLTPEDNNCIGSGCIQIAPSKDSAGRTIILSVASRKKHKEPSNLVRASNKSNAPH